MSVEFVEKKRWLFLGLPFTFTKYVIKEDMITVDTGVFTKVENDCYMYKVQDVEHTASIWERMVGLGTHSSQTVDRAYPQFQSDQGVYFEGVGRSQIEAQNCEHAGYRFRRGRGY